MNGAEYDDIVTFDVGDAGVVNKNTNEVEDNADMEEIPETLEENLELDADVEVVEDIPLELTDGYSDDSDETLAEHIARRVEIKNQSSFFYDFDKSDVVIGRNEAKGIQGVALSSFGVVVGRVDMPNVGEMAEHTQTAMTRYGNLYQGTSYGAKKFNIPMTLVAESVEEYEAHRDELTNLFIKIGDNSEMPITFGFKPDVTWFIHATAMPEFKLIDGTAWIGTATWEFTASDPRGFMPNEVVKITSNPFTFTPKGNGPIDPVYTIIPKSDAYRIGVSNGKKGVYMGQEADKGIVQNNTPLAWVDNAETLSTWGANTSNSNNPVLSTASAVGFTLGDGAVPANGKVAISTGGNIIKIDKFHSTDADWDEDTRYHGPVIRADSISGNTLNDWELTLRLKHKRKYGRANQRIETYLLDSEGHRRARVGISDNPDNRAPFAYVKFGNSDSQEAAALKLGLGIDNTTGGAVTNGENTKVTLKSATEVKAYAGTTLTKKYTVEIWTGTRKKTYKKTTVRTTMIDTATKKATTTTKTTAKTSASVENKSNGGTGINRDCYWAVLKNGAIERRDNVPSNVTPKGYQNIGPDGSVHEGIVQYWEKGQQKRTGDISWGVSAKESGNQIVITYLSNSTGNELVWKQTATNKDVVKGKVTFDGKKRVQAYLVSKGWKKYNSNPKKKNTYDRWGLPDYYTKKTEKKEYIRSKTTVVEITNQVKRATIKANGDVWGDSYETEKTFVYHNGHDTDKDPDDYDGSQWDTRGVLHSISTELKRDYVDKKQTVTTTFNPIKVTVDDYNNESVFSDNYIRFTIRKHGNEFSAEIVDLDKDSTRDGKVVAKMSPRTLSSGDASTYGFALNRIAVFYGKKSIPEDKIVDDKPVKAYSNDSLYIGHAEVKRYLSPNDPSLPHVIVNANTPAVINSEAHDVFSNSVNVNRELAINSSMWQLNGSESVTLRMVPDTKVADWTLEYRPTLK